MQAVLAYVVPPIVVLFILGKFWSGGNARGARATLWLGSLCALVFFLLNGVWRITHLHFLYAAPLLVSVDVLIFVIVSTRHPTVSSVGQNKAMAFASDETAERDGALVVGGLSVTGCDAHDVDQHAGVHIPLSCRGVIVGLRYFVHALLSLLRGAERLSEGKRFFAESERARRVS